ncbi:sigma-70 family RNA polymerase sigma factor [Costertonia aggregata]|uniref:Sigma-70 family RNA polymerase sigma factor n=1 Tax=Costertonia aggregata TaxID=343403 RepID=A0A7H9ARN3_9FLAO|nr:sigma-70 family RNA polymerase sigma factor [Costertonia aggregata]QLG46042.1 sigma-70 family RNA polymerase sigma factor [Costertonia aggregata]
MNPTINDVYRRNDEWLEIAEKFTKCEHRAKDLVQDTYMYLQRRFQNKELEPLKKVTKGYMYRAIKANFLMEKRDNKLPLHYTDEIEKSAFVTNELDFECIEVKRRKKINSALQKVPPLEREVLMQHQEKSQRQLQRETKVCRDRLRLHKDRGMQKLKSICKNDESFKEMDFETIRNEKRTLKKDRYISDKDVETVKHQIENDIYQPIE